MDRDINKQLRRQDYTRRLALAGLFIALNIVLTRFLSFTIGGTFRVGFGLVPLHLAGYLLGPTMGFVVGVLADLLGVLINSFGQMPHPGFTLTSGLHGLIPGLSVLIWRSFNGVRWGERSKVIPIVLTSQFVTIFGVSWLMQSIWVSQLFNVRYLVTAGTRALPTIVQGAVLIATELALLGSRVSVRLNRV